jgi:hypothetical protein
VEQFIINNTWAWPTAEILHFVGLALVVGAVGLFDLRLLGMFKGLPLVHVRRLLRWGVLGFILLVVSGLMFVTGVYANVEIHPYLVLAKDPYLQLKLLFLIFAGVNLLAFHWTGVSRAVDELGPRDDAPRLAKTIGGISIGLWLCIIYFGRLIPWALP